MVMTDDPAVAEHIRSLMNLCFQKENRFHHDELGWNYRFTNLQAAVGMAQLEQIDKFIGIKKRIGRVYQQGLKSIECLQLPLESENGVDNVYWVFGVVLTESTDIDRQELMRLLGEAGIGTRPFFWPIHKQPVFLNQGMFKADSCPVSERIAENGFYLPSGLALTEEQQQEVIEKLVSLLA